MVVIALNEIFLPSRGRIPIQIKNQDVIIKWSKVHKPWFANAFKAGQEHRLSPSLGGMYSGQLPSAPGCPFGVTWSTLRLGVSKLSKKNPKSQMRIPMVWIPLAIGVIRNMGVDDKATFSLSLYTA